MAKQRSSNRRRIRAVVSKKKKRKTTPKKPLRKSRASRKRTVRARMHKRPRRSAAEKAGAANFNLMIHESGSRTASSFLKKNGIPNQEWDKDTPLPTSECIIISPDSEHAAYFDGEYLWNSNDNKDGYGNDQFKDWPGERGFLDFQGGLDDTSHNWQLDESTEGQCFLFAMGYRNIIRDTPTNLDKGRKKLLSSSLSYILTRKRM